MITVLCEIHAVNKFGEISEPQAEVHRASEAVNATCGTFLSRFLGGE